MASFLTPDSAFSVACDRFIICGEGGEKCLICCESAETDHMFFLQPPCGPITVTLNNWETYEVDLGGCTPNIPAACAMCDALNDTFELPMTTDTTRCWRWSDEFFGIDQDPGAPTCNGYYLNLRLILTVNCCEYFSGGVWHHAVFWFLQCDINYTASLPSSWGPGNYSYNVNFTALVADETNTDCDVVDMSSLSALELDLVVENNPAEPSDEELADCIGKVNGGWPAQFVPPITCVNYPYDATCFSNSNYGTALLNNA